MRNLSSRDRLLATMDYQPRDRAPFKEFPWPAWPETAERWSREGGYDPAATDFGCDRWVVEYSWFMPHPPFERKVLEEDERHVTCVDPQGIVQREMKDNPLSSMPQFLRYPVETAEDFRKFWRERMQPDLNARIGPDWRAQLRQHRDRDYVLVIIADRWGGFFGSLRNMVGVERLCELFYDDPALVEEMMEADADFLIAMLDQVLQETTVDVFGFWEDMGFRTSTLLSPAMGRRFMLPRYRKVADFGRSRGVRFFGLDSDGQIDPLIPVWMDSGIDILYPFEVQADMDVLAVRKKFGRSLRIWGGVDKRVLAEDRAAIDAELRRIAPLIEDGGYVPMLDHSATPNIPYANYCYFMEQLPRYL
jgi:uroporphyrinogen decarboxylase